MEAKIHTKLYNVPEKISELWESELGFLNYRGYFVWKYPGTEKTSKL